MRQLRVYNEFQFTHPVWGATIVPVRLNTMYMFQFTHPVWGATLCGDCHLSGGGVSIHAPRVGCDLEGLRGGQVGRAVSIHAPRVGCDDNSRD